MTWRVPLRMPSRPRGQILPLKLAPRSSSGSRQAGRRLLGSHAAGRRCRTLPLPRTRKRLGACACYGGHSAVSSGPSGYEEMTRIASAAVHHEGYIRLGDLALIVSGVPFGLRGATNNLRVVAC